MRGYDGPVRVHPQLETSVSPAPHAAPLECVHDRIHPARHPLPRPALAVPVQARWRPARRARGLRDLGNAGGRCQQCDPDRDRPVPRRACSGQRGQPGTGLVGSDGWPRQTHRYQPLVRGVREFAGQLQGFDRSGLAQSGHGRTVSPRLPRAVDRRRRTRRHRGRARPGYRAAGLRGRQLDGRHDGPCHPDAASGHRAQPRQHFRQRAGVAVLDRDPLAAARSDPTRSQLEQRSLRRFDVPRIRHAHGAQARRHHLSLRAGMVATTTMPNTPSPACAWRASWA